MSEPFEKFEQLPARRPLMPELEGMVGEGDAVNLLLSFRTGRSDGYWIMREGQSIAGLQIFGDGSNVRIIDANWEVVPNVSAQPEAYAWIEQRVKDVGRVGEKGEEAT